MLSEQDNKVIMNMYEEGASISDIAKKVGITVASVRYKITGYYYRQEHLRSSSPLKLEPSYDLSYIIGASLGDGCIYADDVKNTYRVVLGAKSERFAEKFAISANNIGLNVCEYEYSMYIVSINDKQFTLWMKNVEKNIEEHIKGHEKGFLQGFWDAEGCYCISDFCSRVSLSNTNLYYLKVTEQIIKDMGIKCKIYGPYTWSGFKEKGPPIYQLDIMGGKAEREIFLNMIETDVKGIKHKHNS